MLLFSTILDINEKLTYEKFFDLILYWNEHQYYEENIIPGLHSFGEVQLILLCYLLIVLPLHI